MSGLDRFRHDLAGLTAPPIPDAPIGVAVSGGPDSLALLLLAAAAFPGAVVAATVDHGLRAESAEEARGVAAVCADLGVPHETLTLSLTGSANLQARARDARYAALARWAHREGASAVATGHHRDDQAETLLMRAARGAGLSGLAGVRSATSAHDLRIVRPLLGWSRAELGEIVERRGLDPVVDPANDSLRFDRTRARHLLAATPWLAPERLAVAAAHLAEAQDALDWSAAGLWLERRGHDASGAITLAANDLPAELQRRLLLLALGQFGAEEPPGPKLARLLDALRSGRAGTLAGIHAAGGAVWRLSPAPPRGRN